MLHAYVLTHVSVVTMIYGRADLRTRDIGDQLPNLKGPQRSSCICGMSKADRKIRACAAFSDPEVVSNFVVVFTSSTMRRIGGRKEPWVLRYASPGSHTPCFWLGMLESGSMIWGESHVDEFCMMWARYTCGNSRESILFVAKGTRAATIPEHDTTIQHLF